MKTNPREGEQPVDDDKTSQEPLSPLARALRQLVFPEPKPRKQLSRRKTPTSPL